MSMEQLRILALSDLHGKGYASAARTIDEVRPDWVILLGDILPDFSMISGRGNRLEAQRYHWEIYRGDFVRDGVFTTLVRGNHELEGFSDPNLGRLPDQFADKVIRLEGVPAEFGTWGWSREWEETELQEELQAQLSEVSAPMLCLSHVPPFGLLDRTHSGEHIGHRPLRRLLEERPGTPAWILCGHVHESFGTLIQGKTRVANVAGGYAVFEGGIDSLQLMRMERLIP